MDDLSQVRSELRRVSQHASKRWAALWLSASPLRALAEVLVLQMPLLLWALLFNPTQWAIRSVTITPVAFLVLAGPVAILYGVFRMRRVVAPWWARLALYTAMGLCVAITPTAIFVRLWRAFAQNAGPQASGMARFPISGFAIAWLIAFTCAFVFSRFCVRVLVMWNRLRRRHLLWSLTNAHLMVVVIGAGLFALLTLTVNVLSAKSSGLFLTPLQVLPILFFLFIITIILMLLVLPPSALFSFIFARRTTRRLNSLTQVTNAFRAGDLSARVPIVGEDEVAQLQANFNAMASDLERTVRELETERDRVNTLLRSRRELIANVSHELRTPIATLRGYLESTRLHWQDEPPATMRRDLQIMERETIRLQALIDDLFTLSRAEVNRLELRREPIDAGMVARQAVESAAPLAWQRGRVTVAAQVSPDVPLALGDAGRLEQVLLNLLHNGIRHTPPGGIVAVDVAAEPSSIVLEVRDTGEGIAPDDLPHIWERFYRAQKSKEQPASGTGLGLALVKELTEAMGGSVAVTSVLGEGSCFTVRIPRADENAQAAGGPERPAGTSGVRRVPRRAQDVETHSLPVAPSSR